MRHLLALTAALFVWAGPIRADEENVPLDKVPKPVLEAVKKRFPKAEAKEASKETTDGKTVYEVTLKEDKKNIDVTVTPEGAITTIEKEIAFGDLPKAVAETFEKKYPKATYKIVEEVITVKDGKETLEYYEALLSTADKKVIESEVLPDGKFKSEMEKKDEKNGETKESAELPKTLAESLKSKFPGTKVTEVEKEEKDGKTLYEITLKAKGTTLEAVVTAQGDVVKVKVKDREDDEDDKGKKGENEKKKKGTGQSGFQGEQKGQHEDKDDKKNDDKREKGKNKKVEKGN